MSPAARSPEASAALRASLVEAALRVLDREGADGLTMRAVATEAGVALGLPYKVFANRNDLVGAVVAAEFRRLGAAFEAIVASAGTGTVGGNLGRWAEALLGSPAAGLSHDHAGDAEVEAAVDAAAGESGLVAALDRTVVDYLAAEQRLGRVAPGVDVRAFGFLVAGAVHNLLVSGAAYPRPSGAELRRMLTAVAEALAPPG